MPSTSLHLRSHFGASLVGIYDFTEADLELLQHRGMTIMSQENLKCT
jgi:hypothetical protein